LSNPFLREVSEGMFIRNPADSIFSLFCENKTTDLSFDGRSIPLGVFLSIKSPKNSSASSVAGENNFCLIKVINL